MAVAWKKSSATCSWGSSVSRSLTRTTPSAPCARRLDVPMAGRGPELTRIRAAYSSAARTNTPHRLTLLGEAGIGKSRLSRAFAESIGSSALVITGRCPAYGEGITFQPLREAVLDAAGPSGWPSLAERLAREENGARIADQIAGAVGL